LRTGEVILIDRIIRNIVDVNVNLEGGKKNVKDRLKFRRIYSTYKGG
jgi:hypothetical protein